MTELNADLRREQNAPSDFAERVQLNQCKLASDLESHYDFIVCGASTSGRVVTS